ncbi:hypothetical protein [Nocardia sp. NPDC047654]|uniref:hypothetical protein n=1 Tax=Nocardia sp. NPDC047654 TaxID=3364314 RepID=UPI003711FC8F
MVSMTRTAAWLGSHFSPFSTASVLGHRAGTAAFPPTAESGVYPELAPQIHLPLVTRMLLYGDGSTTLLLQQIAGSNIVADVLPSRTIETRDLGIFQDVFRDSVGGPLRVRHTRLRDAAGNIISENLITYRGADEATLIPPDGIPFGIHLRRLGAFERRRIFLTGVTCGPFGLFPAAAAARVYEIMFSTQQSVLVHEVFNPAVVGTRSVAFRRPGPPVVARALRASGASPGLRSIRGTRAGALETQSRESREETSIRTT